MSPSGATDDLAILRRFAPGTSLRNAAELVLRQGTGALVLFADEPVVSRISSGGFVLDDARFTAQRVAELAKMDAGIVVSSDAGTILRANVHFIPDPSIPTSETGTRFRTAERLAQQTGHPVLAISEEGRRTAVVFTGRRRFELRNPNVLHAEGNQSLSSLERLRRRFEHAESRLTRLEVDDVVTVRDVALVLQRAALLTRVHADLARTVIELGGAGHLITVQGDDLMEGVDDTAEATYADYARRRSQGPTVFDRLEEVPTEELPDPQAVSDALGLGQIDGAARPRGVRALARVPGLPESVRDALISHFRTFPKLLNASSGDLGQVEGVGRTRADQLRSYFDRLQQHASPFFNSD
jgi:diadenylate cyclase